MSNMMLDENEDDDLIPGVNDLPEFANADAHKMQSENIEKAQNIEKISDEVANLKERLKVMKDHFKNVQQELEHTNSLNNAKDAEIKTEQHLRQLTSRSLGKGQAESRKIQSEIEFLQNQLNSIQSQIHKSNEKMDEFKMTMNWNQEELEQWAVAGKQKEEDNLALEKYKRADEQKIKELSFQLEQLAKEALENKSKLESENMETLAKQMELDRIAVEFKTAHLERQELVTRWQETMTEMKKRDKEINEIGERFAKAKQERITKEGLSKLQRKKLSLQVSENKDVELKSDALSRIVLRKREEMMIGSNKLIEFRSELDSLKNELTTAAEDIVNQRQRTAQLAHVLEVKKVQLERERQKYQVIKGKLELAKTNTNKAEMTAKQVEDELTKREKEFLVELNRAKVLKEKALKENQVVFELKQVETRLRSEISGNKLISRNLESQLNQLDKDAARQQELLYNAEFQIQQIERKIARGMGERSDEEKTALKKSIEIAENALVDVKDKKKILLSQTRKLQNELAIFKLKKDDFNTKFATFTQDLVERELQNKMIEEEIKHENKDLEEMTVINDLLRLEVRRLRDLLSAKSDAVFSLENRKQQLLLSLQERKQEISVHGDILKGELKAFNDDKHNLLMDLRKREANVERLKARFEAVARQPEEEKYSQAYFIIRAAQKKEELQRRGDELDQEVRKCEREIRALNITLEHLNTRNVAYRESFQKVDIKGFFFIVFISFF
jgi:chromosome segregation ATPase